MDATLAKIYLTDGTVFFCKADTQINYRNMAETSDDAAVHVVFIPTNGPERGKEHYVPLHRIDRIVTA